MDYLDRKRIKPLLTEYFLTQDFSVPQAGGVLHASEWVTKRVKKSSLEDVRTAVRYELAQMKLASEIVRVKWGVYRPRPSH